MENNKKNTVKITNLFRQYRYRLRILLITVFILLILSVFINIWAVIFIIIFSVLNAILISIDRYVNITHDFELSTFSAVMMSVTYGLGWGMAAAFFTKFAEVMYNKNMEFDDLLAMISFMIAAVLGYILKDMNIIIVGIATTCIINMYNFVSTSMVGYYTKYEIIFQVITNILLNIMLFMSFAPWLLKILVLLR